MGETIEVGRSVRKADMEPLFIQTPGGRIQIRWDHQASATPHAQLVFFAEFLSTTGVYDCWVNSCPLRYESGNAPASGTFSAPGFYRFFPVTTAMRTSPRCAAMG